ncbi:sensor histidine kinase [Paenarthrobacter sp. NPDC089675]|uniref:sensor histidine kinase n=1 Tax=Paenarthrobacter sp. NPDC089675 TaxID=3364376 RepID=UPI003815C3C4
MSVADGAAHDPARKLARLGAYFRLTKTDYIVTGLAAPLELVNIMPSLLGVLAHAWAGALAFLMAGFVILLWRGRYPRLVLILLLIHQGLFSPIFYHSLVLPAGMVFDASDFFSIPYIPLFCIIVAVITVGSSSSLWSSILLCIPAVVLSTLIFTAGRPMEASWYVVAAVLWIGGAWAFGRFVGRSTQRINELETEQQRTAAAVAAERALIAAELHDIVSHAVTVMLLHAAGGRRIIEADPVRAAHALDVITTVGSDATNELSRLLGLLKPDNPTTSQKPLPTLDDIDHLIDAVRSAGVDVHLKQTGAPGKLDISVGHTAYRAVQESLTNVSKHVGPGAHATVEITWETSALWIRVMDDGANKSPMPDTDASGYGLLGLKERVQVGGGWIDWGPRGKGFEVQLRLPLAATASGRA